MLLALDSETYLIQPGLAVPKPVCWSFNYNIPAARPFLEIASDGVKRIAYSLGGGVRLALHHAPFDLTVAAQFEPELLPLIFHAYREGLISDTKTRQQLIDIRVGRRKNLATGRKEVLRNGEWVRPDYTLAGSSKFEGSTGLVGLYFGRDRSAQKGPDAWRLRYGELDGVPIAEYPEEARTYAEDDAADTLAVHQAQFTHAQQLGGLTLSDDPESLLVNELEQCRKAFVLKLISSWGIRSDGATLDELERRCLAKRQEVRDHLLEHGLFRYDGPKKDPQRKIVKNTKEVQRRVKEAFEAQGLDVPRGDITPKMAEKGATEGNIKTDKDTLILSGDPMLEELAEAGPASTVLNTFIPALRGGVEVPLNTDFDEMLDNGRISSSRPNLNNLPRGETLHALIGMDVRQAVIARPGKMLVSVDYDCAELRSHAQVNVWLHQEYPDKFPYPDMAKFFQDDPDGDPHLALAAKHLGISMDEAKRRKKAGDPEIKHLRQAKKPTNFGLPGGMGPPKLVESARKSYGVKMTLSEGKNERVQWKRGWREMGPYLDYISANTQNGPWDVKQYVSNRIRGRCGYSDAANTLWSGLTADGAANALWNVAQECYLDMGTALYGSRIVLFIYDELIIEAPECLASDAGKRLAEVMISSMREYLPDIPVTASPALMRRWIKGAEPKYDADGELVPVDI